MIELTLFLLFILVFFWLPGELILQKAHWSYASRARIGTSILVGSVSFIFVTLLVRMVGLPFQALWFYAVAAIFLGLKKKHLVLPSGKNIGVQDIFAIGISFIVTKLLAGSLPLAYIDAQGWNLPASRDALWRLSIIGELVSHFPPQHPGFAGELLKNYHFLYDLLIAATHVLTRISIFSLYTKWYTYLVAFLMFVSVFTFIKLFIKNKYIVWWGTLLTIFTGNVSYVLPWISRQYDFVARSNVFLSDQPFDQSHNPFNLFSYAIFITGLTLFHSSKKNSKLVFVLSLLMGVLVGVKIYAGVVLFFAVGIAWLWELFIVRQKFDWSKILPFVFVAPIVAIIKGKSFGILAFNPGWVLTKMIQDQDRLNLHDMALKEEYYWSVHNYLRIVQYKVMQLGVYFLGNLNIRIFGLLVYIRKIFRKYLDSRDGVLLTAGLVAGLGIPLFFSQTRGVFDSIQFTPYGLLILGFFTVFVFDYIYSVVAHTQVVKTLCIVLSIILFFIASATNIVTQITVHHGQYHISALEREGLDYIRLHSQPDAIILTDLDGDKMAQMYVSAITERRTFLTGKALVEQVGVDIRDRETAIESFFAEPKERKDLLAQNNITYIYLSKEGKNNVKPLLNAGLPEVFSNAEVSVFKAL